MSINIHSSHSIQYSSKFGTDIKWKLISVFMILLFSFIICLPFVFYGVYDRTLDGKAHTLYQYYFSQQFWNGDLYPRWLAEDNKGYGSPMFLIQYPLPYFVTALLRPVLASVASPTREAHELGAYCFVVVSAAGISAWYWFSYRCTPVVSTLASIVYIMLPFFLGQALITRAAIGELTTFVWIPLIFALSDRINSMEWAKLAAIAFAFALLIISNIINAAMFLPIIIAYVAVTNKHFALPILLSIIFGFFISALYLLPFLSYMKYFDGGALVANHPTVFELGRLFLQVTSDDVYDHSGCVPGILIISCVTLFVMYHVLRGSNSVADRVLIISTLGLAGLMLIPGFGPALIDLSNLRVSGFDSQDAYAMRSLFTVLLTAGLGALAYCRIAGGKINNRDRLLLVSSCIAVFFMLPWSAAIWRVAPGLWHMQHPWRLCAIVTVVNAALFATAADDCLRSAGNSSRKPSLFATIFLALIVIGAGGAVWRVERPWRALSAAAVEPEQQVDEAYITYVPAKNLAGFASLLGASPNTYDVARTSVQTGVQAKFVSGEGVVSVERKSPRVLHVVAENRDSARLQFNQLSFPLWTLVHTEGRPGEAAPGDKFEELGISPENLIEVSLAAGRHDFELIFDGGWPEKLGATLTVVSVLIALCGFLLSLSRNGRGATTARHLPREPDVARQ